MQGWDGGSLGCTCLQIHLHLGNHRLRTVTLLQRGLKVPFKCKHFVQKLAAHGSRPQPLAVRCPVGTAQICIRYAVTCNDLLCGMIMIQYYAQACEYYIAKFNANKQKKHIENMQWYAADHMHIVGKTHIVCTLLTINSECKWNVAQCYIIQ